MEAGCQITSGPSTKSLASWHEAHGFRILCLIDPKGEHFFVGPDEVQQAAGQAEANPASWTDMSEPQLRQYLAKKGLSASDTEDAIQLFREWATRFTGSSVFPAPLKSN